jgi:hypothetical protein
MWKIDTMKNFIKSDKFSFDASNKMRYLSASIESRKKELIDILIKTFRSGIYQPILVVV